MTHISGKTFQEEHIWQKFLTLTREGVIDFDFETRQIRCSPQLIRNLKLTPETLPRTLEQWSELYHIEDYAKSQELRYLLFESEEEAFSLERRLYCGDGHYRRLRMDAVCFRDPMGKIQRLIGVETVLPQDANDQREEMLMRLTEMERRLALSREENARAAFVMGMANAIPDLLFFYELNGDLTFHNAAFANVLSRNPDLTEWAIRVAKKSAGSQSEEQRSYEDAYGRLRDLRTLLVPFSQGATKGVIGISSDVTELEEMEADMTRLKRLLGKISLSEKKTNPETETEIEIKTETEVEIEVETDKEKPSSSDFSSSSSAFSSREGVDLNSNYGKEVGKRLEDALNALSDPRIEKLFPARREQIETLLRAAERAELEVGVIGITSSGKSTFINAMMGEQLLPEETQATTNLVIRCRKGEERSVTVVLQNGERKRVLGLQLTAGWMEGLASERLNPANKKAVAFLEWTSPAAAVPEGLVLVDTPGLDACDFPEHSEMLLRQLLLTLDVVIYVTSIRNPLKAADLESLEAVLEQDQKVIFLLSQIDMERDDTEAGKVVFSRERKLSAYVQELRRDIEKNFPKECPLGNSTIIPVSSKLAMRHFYDRESAAWQASNFGFSIKQLETFQVNLNRCRIEARAKRAFMLLSRTALDVELALKSASSEKTEEKAESEARARREKVHALRDAQRWVNAEIAAVRNEWRRSLDPQYHMDCLKKAIESANTLKGIQNRYERWGKEWEELSAQITFRMDRARRSCRDILQKHDLVSGDCFQRALDDKSELPSFSRYVFYEAQEVRVRGWFENLEFWPRYEVFSRREVDRNKMLAGVGMLLSERLRLLNEHLSWWEARMKEDYCDLLYEELRREEAALVDVDHVVADASASREALSRALENLRDAEKGIEELTKSAIDLLASEHSEDLETSDPNVVFTGQEIWKSDWEKSSKNEPEEKEEREQGIFAPLLATFHEQNIQSRFLELDGLRRSRRIVLLGLRRHDSLGFLSRLAHDLAMSDTLGAENEEAWLACGSTLPALPYVPLDVPDSLLRQLEVLVAPSDGLCNLEGSFHVDWDDLFTEWLPIVHLDIARIDSGLSDLARAPYMRALAHADSWIAASGQGALFNGRLSDLLTDVPERMDLFTRSRECGERVEWFVYENYDARYTDFMLWGRNLEQGSDETLLQKWAASGHDFKFPFTKLRLRFALEGARRKKKSVANFHIENRGTA
ncbi:MAG: dynamin family protein [Synergistaceae bacterium]|jgi:predicted GTPase/PAS domain-containing protein|nr:dynamin family protein [Synergistaceae bacterium]